MFPALGYLVLTLNVISYIPAGKFITSVVLLAGTALSPVSTVKLERLTPSENVAPVILFT